VNPPENRQRRDSCLSLRGADCLRWPGESGQELKWSSALEWGEEVVGKETEPQPASLDTTLVAAWKRALVEEVAAVFDHGQN